MITNAHVLVEMNRLRRAQVAEDIAALRVSKDGARPRISWWSRRPRPATTAQPATGAYAFSTGSNAR